MTFIPTTLLTHFTTTCNIQLALLSSHSFITSDMHPPKDKNNYTITCFAGCSTPKLDLCLWFYRPIDDLRQSLTCPKPHRTLCNIADTKIVCTKGFMGLVDMYCKLQSITFSHNKTNLDPSESLFFPAKPAGVHKKRYLS